MKLSFNDLKEEELLGLRISQLDLNLEESALNARVTQLYAELNERGILFRPLCYLADEWFVPTGSTCIGIPFYLAHPRLIQLEKKIMLEAEGEDEGECQKLLRHEAGHALFYAFELGKNKKLRALFGPSSDETPDTYRPRPYSRSYVRHLPNWYAQCDPDEDFAETFAVWLDPKRDWRGEYAGWRALRKLEAVDEAMAGLKNTDPVFIRNEKACEARKLKSRLSRYYQQKKKEAIEEYPEFYDPDLRKIFSDDPRYATETLAGRWMKKNRRVLIDKISFWTGEKKYNCDRLLRKLMDRCEALCLRLCKNETESLMDVTAYLTKMMTNHLLTGKYKRSV